MVKKKGYSRREFIKQNSLLGLGTLFTMGVGSSVINSSVLHETTRIKEGHEPPFFFDGFAEIGPRRYKHPAEKYSVDHLLKEMEHCSISGALVAYTLSVTYDPMYSNLELSGMLEPHPHLFPIWNAMPHQTEEFPSPQELGRRMKGHNVQAITLHPNSNGWDWKAEHSDELLGWLSQNQILTIVTSDELGGWTAVDQFLGRYPNLPVLLTNAGWIEQRYLLPLVESHKNLHISFDHFQIHEGIKSLHESGHTDQLIFATNSPSMSAGAHRCYVDYANISEDVRSKVAGGNLIRLLKGQKPPKKRVNEQEDKLMAAVRHGRPIPVPLIDMHMHILHEGLNGGGGAGYRMKDGGPEGVFRQLKQLDYQGGGFMSWNGTVSPDSIEGNECTRQALDAAPNGYWGLATFDPTHYSQSELKDMIPEVYSDKRFIGMKPYHYYGVEYHHPSYDVWWEFGNKHEFYGLIHSSREDFLEVRTLAEKYQNSNWVIAHAGSSWKWADMAIDAMKKHPNIYSEITFTSVNLGIIEYLVDAVGDERILYGSDLPMRDPRQQLGWVVFSRLPMASKMKILAENSYKVIEPCLDRLPEYNKPDYSFIDKRRVAI